MDINYALVEETRPPVYTAMKYWGKKPHNIWRQYIETYTPENGVCLDPFCGSGISVIEAIKSNRKVIGFDLNPLSTFCLNVITSDFNKTQFEQAVDEIILEVKKDEIYQKIYTTKSRYSNSIAVVQHFKWNNGNIYEMGILSTEADKNNGFLNARYLSQANDEDIALLEEINSLNIIDLYPNEPFPNSSSFSANFIKCIGGNNFSNLWTKRNLYVISKIFNLIINGIYTKTIKEQLLFGFIQMLHLTTKMCVPRNKDSNRDFSTSWGRSAYLCSKRQMEQNPLLVFHGSCLGKQSVESALIAATKYIQHPLKIKNVSQSDKKINDNVYNAKVGVVDIGNIDQYIQPKSVDFIITDPPYGGLVQYLDLSYIWLSWLQMYDEKLKPNFDAEITIKKGKIDLKTYQARFTNGLKKLYTILKDDGKIVFTFHNQNISIWNAFLHSISESGFCIEKVIHQQNKRSGESAVANPYGTSGTDFYIRCSKNKSALIKTTEAELEHFILHSAIKIIALRNEPTPYQILFNGILAEMSTKGFLLEDFDSTIESVLSKYIDKTFKLTENTFSTAGNLWWFINSTEYIKYPNIPLADRVDSAVLGFFRRKVSATFDEILGEIFTKFPNGLTPDIKSINEYIKKYAVKSSGKWLYKQEEIEKEISNHTKVLKMLSEIGRKLQYDVYIGKREQWEKIDNKRLSDYATIKDLGFLNIDKEKCDRLEMIDMIWLHYGKIVKIIEVENSTNLMSAIQRASNADINTEKLMVIPDRRENEVSGHVDQLFIDSFKTYNWKYIIYSDIERLLQSNLNNINIIDNFSKEL